MRQLRGAGLRSWLLVTAFVLGFASLARAGELDLSAVALHLPASSYHYLAASGRFRFGKDAKKGGAFLEAGMTPPFTELGYTQTVMFAAIGKEWGHEWRPWARGYFGLGIGTYADRVNDNWGVVPSIVTSAGLRVGGKHFGLALGVEGFIGVYSLGQLQVWTVWPLTNLTGGIYVAI